MSEHDSPEEIAEELSGSSALRSRVIAAVVLQALMATASASAKVAYEPGFGPPAYPERFLHALLGLRPLVTRTNQIKSGR